MDALKYKIVYIPLLSGISAFLLISSYNPPRPVGRPTRGMTQSASIDPLLFALGVVILVVAIMFLIKWVKDKSSD